MTVISNSSFSEAIDSSTTNLGASYWAYRVSMVGEFDELERAGVLLSASLDSRGIFITARGGAGTNLFTDGCFNTIYS